MNYAEQLKSPMWQKKRLKILQRDNFTCLLCSDTETELHIHHKEYKSGKKPWEYEDSNFQTFCKYCHCIVECFKEYKLTPIISNKYFMDKCNIWVISTILNSQKHGLILAINYYSDESNTQELITTIERTEFKGINTLFDHAEKLIKNG